MAETIGHTDEMNIKLEIPNMIKAAEIKYDLPQGLLQALVLTESSGNHKVFVKNDGSSNKTSYGLVQIQLDSARLIQRIKAKEDGVLLAKRDFITPKKLMKPETNLDYGAAYLKWLLNTHKNDVSLALSCWNVGVNSSICKGGRYYGPYVGKIFNNWIKTKE